MRSRTVELVAGVFILCALLALLFLAYRVSDFGKVGNGDYYHLSAEFDNIGDLKVRAPVSVSGVKVGEITSINLDRQNFRAVVNMKIHKKYNNLPMDTSANIFTQGILGSNYINLSPGFDAENLKNNGRIVTTHSAVILENIIGQLIYSLKSDSGDKKSNSEVGEKGVQPSAASAPAGNEGEI